MTEPIVDWQSNLITQSPSIVKALELLLPPVVVTEPANVGEFL